MLCFNKFTRLFYNVLRLATDTKTIKMTEAILGDQKYEKITVYVLSNFWGAFLYVGTH